MIINIINEPETAKDYEFVVGSPIDDERTYFFQGMFKNGYDAEQCAKKCNGIVFHNVRIQGKRKSPKEKY